MRQPDDYTEQEAAEIESGIEGLQDMSDTEIFKRWHKERMGHPLGVQLGISAVRELEAKIEELNKKPMTSYEFNEMYFGVFARRMPEENQLKVKGEIKDDIQDCAIKDRIAVVNGQCMHEVSIDESCVWCNHGIPF